ncbi:hypothetical protein G7Y79_00024g056270 [Physcia stellaris]|nr:hypothetical protein G7Y79_00024g056270 [Physcia stellaris]
MEQNTPSPPSSPESKKLNSPTHALNFFGGRYVRETEPFAPTTKSTETKKASKKSKAVAPTESQSSTSDNGAATSSGFPSSAPAASTTPKQQASGPMAPPARGPLSNSSKHKSSASTTAPQNGPAGAFARIPAPAIFPGSTASPQSSPAGAFAPLPASGTFSASTAPPQDSSAGAFDQIPELITPDHPDYKAQPARPPAKSTLGQTSNIPKGKPKVSSEDSAAESPPTAPAGAMPPTKSAFGQTSNIPKGKPKVSSEDSSAESPTIAPSSTVQPARLPMKSSFGQTSNIPKGKPSSPAPASQAPLTATGEADATLSKSQTSAQQPPADNGPPTSLSTPLTKAPFNINDQTMAWLDPSVPRPPGLPEHRSEAYNPLRDTISAILYHQLEPILEGLVGHIRHAATRVIEEHIDRVFVSSAVCHETLLEAKMREEKTPRIEAELREELKSKVREQLVQAVYDDIRKEEREKCKAEFQGTLEQERQSRRAEILKEKSHEFLDWQRKYDDVNHQCRERKKDLDKINSEIRNQKVQQGILTKEIKSKMQTLTSLSSSKKNEVEGQAQMNTLPNSTSSDHVPSAPLASSLPSEPAAAVGQSAAPQRPQLTSNTQAPGVSVATTTVTASPTFSTDDRSHTNNVDDANERLGFGTESGAGVSGPPPVQGAQTLAGSKRGRRRDSDNDVHRQSKRIRLDEDEFATGDNTHASIDRTRPSRDISGHIVDQTLYGVEDVIENPGADDWSGLKAAHQSNSPPIDCEPRTTKPLERSLGESHGRGQWEADNAFKPHTVDEQASEAGPAMSATVANEVAETMTTDRKAKTKRSTSTKTKKETMSALEQHTSEGIDDLVPIKEEDEEVSVMEQPAKRRPGRPRKNITGQSVNTEPRAPSPAVVIAPTRTRRGPKTNTKPATVKLEGVTDGRVQKQTNSRYPRRHKAQPQPMTIVNREEEEAEEEL